MKRRLAVVLITSGVMSVANALPGTVYISPSLSYQTIRPKHGAVRYIGFTPRIALGYGDAITDVFYLAGEVFIIPGSFTHADTTAGIGSLKPQYSIGIDFLPSIILDSDVMAYLRLGVISTRFGNFAVTKAGYQIGLGLETIICKPWTLRGEFVYTGYSSFPNISAPYVQEYTLGLVYRFL